MKKFSLKKLVAAAVMCLSVMGLQVSTFATMPEQYAVVGTNAYMYTNPGTSYSQPVLRVPQGTSFDEVVAQLPKYVQVCYTYGYDPAWTVAEISWQQGSYVASRAGSCEIQGTLALDGLSNPNNITAKATINVLAPIFGFGPYMINGQSSYNKSVTVAAGTSLESILPDQVQVYTGYGYDSYRPFVNVTWDTSDVDLTTPGTYTLTGDFEMPTYSYNRDNIYPTYTITVQ